MEDKIRKGDLVHFSEDRLEGEGIVVSDTNELGYISVKITRRISTDQLGHDNSCGDTEPGCRYWNVHLCNMTLIRHNAENERINFLCQEAASHDEMRQYVLPKISLDTVPQEPRESQMATLHYLFTDTEDELDADRKSLIQAKCELALNAAMNSCEMKKLDLQERRKECLVKLVHGNMDAIDEIVNIDMGIRECNLRANIVHDLRTELNAAFNKSASKDEEEEKK